jgi:hypothetical protein
MADTQAMIRGYTMLAAAATAMLSFPVGAAAQSATQVVHFQVNAVNQIAVAGNPTLAITTATAGSGLTSAIATGSSYAITTNEANQKITASINQAMPAGVVLEVQLDAPGGALSAGTVQLGTSSADVVTGISATAAAALPITYRLNASTQVQLGPTARTVTFTIVSGT